MTMSDPPQKLDGAIVLRVSEEGDYGVVRYVDENRDEPIVRLAICQYATAGDETYVFDCDAEWNVIGDSLFSSVEEAQAAQLTPYNRSIEWTIVVGEITDEMRRAAEEQEAAALSEVDTSDVALRELISQGVMIEAIRRLRLAGMSLMEASDHVKKLASPDSKEG